MLFLWFICIYFVFEFFFIIIINYFPSYFNNKSRQQQCQEEKQSAKTSYFTAHMKLNISLASFLYKWCSLPHRAHRWCPQRYMGRAKRALIKGFDQKKTHHLPSSPPFCTQWIHGQNDAGQVSYKNRRFAVNIYRKDLREGNKRCGLKIVL